MTLAVTLIFNVLWILLRATLVWSLAPLTGLPINFGWTEWLAITVLVGLLLPSNTSTKTSKE